MVAPPDLAENLIGTWESAITDSEWGPVQFEYAFSGSRVLRLTMSDGQGSPSGSQSFVHRYELVSDELTFIPSTAAPNLKVHIHGDTLTLDSSDQATHFKRVSADDSVENFIADTIAELKSSDHEVRWRALQALQYAGPAARGGVSELIAALDDEDLPIRQFAIEALANIGLEEERVIPSLISVLKHNDAMTASFAARGLGRFGSDAKAAVPMLRECALSNDYTLAQSAAEALKKITKD